MFTGIANTIHMPAAGNAGPGVSCPAGPLVSRAAPGSNLLLGKSRAFWNGVGIDFTIGEYRIVELLVSRPGQYFTYRAIYDCLRHEGFVAGEGPRGHWPNVRSAIKRIRKKFRAVDAGFDEIRNGSAVGYCWRGPE